MRIDRHLFQEDIANLFKVSVDTIANWEKNRFTPHVSYYKAIIQFLGYYPFNTDTAALGGKITKYRYINGLTHRQMGRKVGVNASAIAAWESGENKPKASSLEKIKKFIEVI